MTWPFNRGPVPEPPDDRGEWTLERKQRANLIGIYQGDIQRAVTAWEAYQEDLGRYGRAQ